MSTPDLPQRLAQLNAAIHSGERTVTDANGASVTYRSLDEMLSVRRDLEAQIAVPGSGRRRTLVARASFTTLRGG